MSREKVTIFTELRYFLGSFTLLKDIKEIGSSSLSNFFFWFFSKNFAPYLYIESLVPFQKFFLNLWMKEANKRFFVSLTKRFYVGRFFSFFWVPFFLIRFVLRELGKLLTFFVIYIRNKLSSVYYFFYALFYFLNKFFSYFSNLSFWKWWRDAQKVFIFLEYEVVFAAGGDLQSVWDQYKEELKESLETAEYDDLCVDEKRASPYWLRQGILDSDTLYNAMNNWDPRSNLFDGFVCHLYFLLQK